MSSQPIRTQRSAKEEYNSIPVYYCKDCLSLKIRSVEGFDNTDYCDTCGSTCIDKINIDGWETLYKNKYGFSYLNNDY